MPDRSLIPKALVLLCSTLLLGVLTVAVFPWSHTVTPGRLAAEPDEVSVRARSSGPGPIHLRVPGPEPSRSIRRHRASDQPVGDAPQRVETADCSPLIAMPEPDAVTSAPPRAGAPRRRGSTTCLQGPPSRAPPA